MRNAARSSAETPATNKLLSLEKRRQQLQKQIQVFQEGSSEFMSTFIHLLPAAIDHALPENIQLPFPSSLERPPGFRFKHEAQERQIKNKEMKLRKGQANDILQRLREVVSHLSFQYIGKVRDSDSTRHTTRAWKGVADLQQELKILQELYNHCRRRMLLLVDEDRLQELGYRILADADCDTSELIFNPNARGISNLGLSWIWALSGAEASADKYLIECKPSSLIRYVSETFGHFASLPPSLFACKSS